MDSGLGGIRFGQGNSNSQKGKGRKRHSVEQIQQLETFFKENPRADEKQRQQLGRDLGLDPDQIKFWFQNKRTQTKVQHGRADNNSLRAENGILRGENLEMQEILKNVACPACTGSSLSKDDKQLNLQRLIMENAQLKLEHKRKISCIPNYAGNSTSTLPGREPHSSLSMEYFQDEQIGSIPQVTLAQTPYQLTEIQDTDRYIIVETAVSAMDELAELLRLKEPVWVKSHIDERYSLHCDNYNKLFPKLNCLKTSNARIESSKDSGEVAMAAVKLIEMFLDSNKWKNLFPTIVTKAKTIEVLETGSIGGSLHLMYEKIHVLSPLVAPRDFFFIRYCRQVNSKTWMMVDVSYDFIKELHDAAPTRSWKLPSGCMIEDLSNGKSSITWIEHIQVDDKLLIHALYRDSIYSCQAYRAKRWILSLQRICERLTFPMEATTYPRHELEGVIGSAEGRRNLMKLSQRMMASFCEMLSISDKLDFPHLSELNNSGVRVSLRKSSGLGEPDGFIVSATSSLWLPISHEYLFDFFKDEKKRAQWDVLASGRPINTIAHISTGINHGNSVSIMQPFTTREDKMLLLQESSIDQLGAMMIYAPTNLHTVSLVIKGDDTTKVQILPSGFIISTDGRPDKASGASSSNASTGSLLTVAFQILVCCNTLSKKLSMESVATVHALISSTIRKIKSALDFSEDR